MTILFLLSEVNAMANRDGLSPIFRNFVRKLRTVCNRGDAYYSITAGAIQGRLAKELRTYLLF